MKITLRDGSLAHIRPICADDQAALFAFYQGLSADSRALRFQGSIGEATLRKLAAEHTKPAADAFGVVALSGSDQNIVGHAMWSVIADARAEIAFAIADHYQGRGLGTVMLGRLADEAGTRNIDTFEASVLPHNHQMITVFRDSGFAVQLDVQPGEVRVRMPTEMTEDAQQRFEQREWVGAVRAVTALLQPKSVAVIGASRDARTIGGKTLHNLLSFGFNGPVFPINPSADFVQSVHAYKDVAHVPDDVDLAVIVVPAAHVVSVARDCARKGVKSLVVISAGFSETDEAGRARQNELMDVCRASGMRLIGPNCMGILNTAPDVRMNATFAPVLPPTGSLGIMSQSGALGLALMEEAGLIGLGISSFVSVGNKADLSGNDLIQYWHDDDATDVILLYLESFGNPRKFARIARKVARTKPIIVVKSGRYSAGARATASHTGALVAASDTPVDALLQHSGVIRTDTLGEMFDVAALLACQPPPRGRRVGILTNAGGPAILAADACEAEGLDLPELSAATRAELARILPTAASTSNPVDMIASATIEQYREAVRILLRDPGIDSLIVIFIPPLATRPGEIARAILEGVSAESAEKTVLTVFMQAHGVPAELRSEGLQLPSYRFPENAAIALAKAVRYGEWLARPPAQPIRLEDMRDDEAASIIAAALARGDSWLSGDDVRALLSCYGVPVIEQEVTSSASEAGAAARKFGGRVALKGVAPQLVHKTDVGAVRLNLEPDEVEAAALTMQANLQAAGYATEQFLVQLMAGSGVEMLIGMVQDERFGPVVACGAGGTTVELIKDVAVRLAPLSRDDAEAMIAELKTSPLLHGYRGSTPKDVDALVDVLLRISQLGEGNPRIAELDLNPVIVHEEGATIVDARIRLG
jgi:acetyl coenzyme A synthetase (ADP forming)-like protein